MTSRIEGTAHLFPVLHARLIELLAALEPDEWALPTVAGTWTVKEVAAHLLDTQERLIVRVRGESASPSPAIDSSAALAAFINRINAEGVARYRQLDPAALIALMDKGAAVFAEYFQSLDPSGVAPFGVSWAGEQTSANWFDTAREYTERWHHQQQIRLATGRPGIMTRELYHPVLDCFMRALPFSYREKTAAPGAIVRFTIAGDCGGTWSLHRDAGGWRLADSTSDGVVSEITVPQDLAWRVFTKGISRDDARGQVRVSGDPELGLHLLSTVAIVA
jgi:uncharacterized protein (TIGR03083 family)